MAVPSLYPDCAVRPDRPRPPTDPHRGRWAHRERGGAGGNTTDNATMNPKQLIDFDDDRAVSPVIGVVLMLTATVIIGGVVASFVTGMGTGLDAAPQATIDIDYNDADGNLTITHEGGATIPAEQLEIRSSNDDPIAVNATDSVSSGTVISEGSVDTSSTVRVVWTGENGDQTTPLAKWTGPDA